MRNLVSSALVLFTIVNVATAYMQYNAMSASSSFGDSRATNVEYGQAPDGTCYRRTTTVINGQQQVRDDKIDCKEMERMLKVEQERTKQQVAQQFNKINQDIVNTQNTIWSALQRSFGNLHLNFRY